MNIFKEIAVNFIKEHWKDIVKEKCEIKETKTEFLELLSRDRDLEYWVITELMSWGCDKNYLLPYVVEHENKDEYNVYKFGNKFYQWGGMWFIETTPTYKQILIFEQL